MTSLWIILRLLLTGTGLWVISGTSLSLTKWQHWYPRAWDFPRLQALGLLGVVGLGYTGVKRASREPWRWYDKLLMAALGVTAAYHSAKILPYTRAWKRQVRPAAKRLDGQCIRLVTSNVLMENRQIARWLSVVQAAEPDVILAVETNGKWAGQLANALSPDYPHKVLVPKENHYGMCFFSRLPIVKHEVRYLVQQDIPSMQVTVRLPGGREVDVIGLHPRPPEPIRDQDSAPRDAELVIVGKALGEQSERDGNPTLVAGDLNDVAWSRTTGLFRRLSGLLDPRIGRKMLNTFDANNFWLRFPLDHVFHSNDFTLIELRRLEHVGSDHFPVLVELCLEADAEARQPEPGETGSDREEAAEKIQAGQEARPMGDGEGDKG